MRFDKRTKNAETARRVQSMGKVGMRFGAESGGKKAKAVVSVAVQDAADELVAAVGAQFTALPSAVDPFLN